MQREHILYLYGFLLINFNITLKKKKKKNYLKNKNFFAFMKNVFASFYLIFFHVLSICVQSYFVSCKVELKYKLVIENGTTSNSTIDKYHWQRKLIG